MLLSVIIIAILGFAFAAPIDEPPTVDNTINGNNNLDEQSPALKDKETQQNAAMFLLAAYRNLVASMPELSNAPLEGMGQYTPPAAFAVMNAEVPSRGDRRDVAHEAIDNVEAGKGKGKGRRPVDYDEDELSVEDDDHGHRHSHGDDNDRKLPHSHHGDDEHDHSSSSDREESSSSSSSASSYNHEDQQDAIHRVLRQACANRGMKEKCQIGSFKGKCKEVEGNKVCSP